MRSDILSPPEYASLLAPADRPGPSFGPPPNRRPQPRRATKRLRGGAKLTAFLASLACLLSPPEVQADTEVQGTVFLDTTWELGHSPYRVIGDLRIANQAKLTIEPGVQVLVAETDALASNEDAERVEIIVDGELEAIGTESEPIKFRPADGNAPSTWYGLVASDQARVVALQRCEIVGATQALDYRSLRSLDLRHVAFASFTSALKVSSAVDSVRIVGASFTYEPSSPVAVQTAVDIDLPDTTSTSVVIRDSVLEGAVEIAAKGPLNLTFEGNELNRGLLLVQSDDPGSTAAIVGGGCPLRSRRRTMGG